ncbi:uncharacterized protein LOC119514680 [Choloepus didactylus]|uniref:uncharacterized protein LOC119514680 n=1 Tax=Choloepus didactylus TaxID=27675 RepID=UPI00189F5416|nr:uncharacterized protein LOC119514680 [Choloepus didactylus]
MAAPTGLGLDRDLDSRWDSAPGRPSADLSPLSAWDPEWVQERDGDPGLCVGFGKLLCAALWDTPNLCPVLRVMGGHVCGLGRPQAACRPLCGHIPWTGAPLPQLPAAPLLPVSSGPRGPCGGTAFPSCSLAPQWSNHCRLNQNQLFGSPFQQVLQVQGGGRITGASGTARLVGWIKNHVYLKGSWQLRTSQKPMLRILLPVDPKGNPEEEPGVQNRDSEDTVELKLKNCLSLRGSRLLQTSQKPKLLMLFPADPKGNPQEVTGFQSRDPKETVKPKSQPQRPCSGLPGELAIGPGLHAFLGAVTFLCPLSSVLDQTTPSPRGSQRPVLLCVCLWHPCFGPESFSVQGRKFCQDWFTSNCLSLRGSWQLWTSQKPMLRILLPVGPKGKPEEEPGVQNRDCEDTVELKLKVGHLEAEDDCPVVPAPCCMDNSPLGQGPHGLLGAVTFLWPLGLELAQPLLSPRGFRRSLLLQAFLQLPCCGPGRFSVQRGQFWQDGVTSVRARPQASVHVQVRKSLLPFASVRPEGPGAARGFNLVMEGRLCPRLNFSRNFFIHFLVPLFELIF